MTEDRSRVEENIRDSERAIDEAAEVSQRSKASILRRHQGNPPSLADRVAQDATDVAVHANRVAEERIAEAAAEHAAEDASSSDS